MSVLKFISLILLSLLIFVSFHCRPTSSWFQAPMLHGIDIWIDVQGCCHWSVFITHCATDEKEGFNFNKFEQGLVVTMLDDHWIKIIQMFQALPTLTIKHEYLRSRAYKCLSLSSPLTDRYSKLIHIEILVLISWVSHPWIFSQTLLILETRWNQAQCFVLLWNF